MNDYYPRPGTKIFDACQAIEKARGLAAGPLADIFDCEPNEVKTRLKIPLDNRYLRYERRNGLTFFCMNPDHERMPDEPLRGDSEDYPKQTVISANDAPAIAAMRDQLMAAGRLKGPGEASAVIHINVDAAQAMAVLKALSEIPA